MSVGTDQLRDAIAGLSSAARAEFIEPDGMLGLWVTAQKKVLNALYVLEEGREEQMRTLIEGARALIENARATAEAEAARAETEVRKADQFITKAKIELAQAQTASIETIGKGIAAHVQGALVIRAKAYNTTKYLTTALLYAVVLLGTLLGGYRWNSHEHAASDETRMWERCKATMVVDKQDKVSCSPAFPAAAAK